MGSRFSSIPGVSRFSSIQKSRNMILLRPALALLPFLFSCGFSAHLSSTTTTTPCPLGLHSEITGSPDNHGSGNEETIEEGNMGSHENEEGEKAECDFSDIDNIDGQLYTIQNVQTNEDGILKFEFNNNNVLIEVRLVDEPRITFDCANEVCTSNDVVEAGSWTVEVKNGFYGDDGTFANGMFDSAKWDTIPLIKTYFVDDKNYCEGAGGASGDHSEETTGSPTGMRKKRSPGSVYLSPCPHGLWCPRGRIPVHIVDGECQCVRTGSPRSRRSSSVDSNLTVDCGGGHYAPSCEECTQGKGSEGCNGECVWIGGPDNTGLCKSDIVSGER